MPAEDIQAYLAIFERHQPRFVLEWGCGGSTTHFSRQACVERWVAIEHDAAWADEVSKQMAPKVTVHLTALRSDDYVDLPKRLGLQPDLVIVDGRRRNACLRIARQIVSPRGVVLLHDSSRQRYEAGMSLFPIRSVMTFGTSDTRRVDSQQVDGLYWHQGVTALYV